MSLGSPQSQTPFGDGPQAPKRHHWRRNEEDVRKWAELFGSGVTILRIADRYHVDPNTISQQLHRLGCTITAGHHMVEQLPLKYSSQFIQLVDKGPEAVLEFLTDRVWGIRASPTGAKQLRSFCEFVKLHHHGVGVEEIAQRISAHRSTIAHWRNGTDQPYLVRAVSDTLPIGSKPGWRLLPMHLSSGGSYPSEWIRIPQTIASYNDLLEVIHQIQPLAVTYRRARVCGLGEAQIQAMKPELFAYQLGIMLGDSGKLGGRQARYSSMNLDLQLTMKQPTNERLGEFVMMCANSLGIEMERKSDKQPSGDTALARHPSAAYRWTSERSPLLAWMFSVGLGLKWEETTTAHQVRMNWIFDTPRNFRTRFVQGVADSDGCVKRYIVEIASVPNAQFLANLLQGLGMRTAHVSYEGGDPLKTMVSRREASPLPIFSEFVRSYRYQRMMDPSGT